MITPVLSSSWWPPILQTAVGGLLAIVGGAFGLWFSWQRERQSLAAAFAAEIQAILDVVAWREAREGVLQGKNFPISEDPFPVWKANVGKIGILPPDLASKVTGFYGRTAGMVQDFITLSTRTMGNETQIRRRLAENIEELEPEGRALVAQLRKEAERGWYPAPTVSPPRPAGPKKAK